MEGERSYRLDRRQFLKAAIEIVVGSTLVGGGIGDRIAGGLIDRKIWRDTRKEVVAEGNTPPSKLDEVVDARAIQKKAEEGQSVERDWAGLTAPLPGMAMSAKGIRDWQIAKRLGPTLQALNDYEALTSRAET